MAVGRQIAATAGSSTASGSNNITNLPKDSEFSHKFMNRRQICRTCLDTLQLKAAVAEL
jgi:hypothetical protein